MSECCFLSYQGYGSGPSYVAPLEGVSGVTEITNPGGIITYPLANFAEVTPSGTDFTVRVNAGLQPVFPEPSPSDYDLTVTVGLIGCSLNPGAVPWEDDLVACQLTADASLNQTTFGTMHPWMMQRWNSDGTGQELIEDNRLLGGGGLTNFLFSGIPYHLIANPDGQDWDFRFPAWGDAGSRLRIGSFFIGFDIPLTISPSGFAWTTEIVNDRFLNRAGGMISSDGSVRRGASFEAVNVPVGAVTGKDALFGDTSPATYRSNLFRAAIANVGQPMLLNPYPSTIEGHVSAASADPEAAALSNMQSFFSIYGLLDRRMEFRHQVQPGLKTTYAVRINFTESR